MTESQIKEIMYALTLQRAMAFPKNKTVNGSIFLHRKRSNKIRNMWMARWKKRGWEESAGLMFNYWSKQIDKSSEVPILPTIDKLLFEFIDGYKTQLNEPFPIIFILLFNSCIFYIIIKKN